MRKQHTQRQEISNKMYLYLSNFLDELEGLQQGPNHMLDTYQLSVRPLTAHTAEAQRSNT